MKDEVLVETDGLRIEWVLVPWQTDEDRMRYPDHRGLLIRDLTMRVPDEVLLTPAQARAVCQRLGVLLAEPAP